MNVFFAVTGDPVSPVAIVVVDDRLTGFVEVLVEADTVADEGSVATNSLAGKIS